MKRIVIPFLTVALFLVAGTRSEGRWGPHDIGGLQCWIKPLHFCTEINDDGSMTAYMGYRTECASSGGQDLASSYDVPIGENNRFDPGPENRGQPETFPAGIFEDVFAVEISAEEADVLLHGGPGHNLVWHVTGKTAKVRPHVLCDDEGF